MLTLHKKIENKNHEGYRGSKDETIRRNCKRHSRARIDRMVVWDHFEIRASMPSRRDPRVDG